MTKQDFLSELKKALSRLSFNDTKESLEYYSEMIDELIEEGRTEEDAVLAIGSVDDIVAQIMADYNTYKTESKKKKQKKQPKAWEIVLLALGSPLWISLVVTAFAVCFSLYAALFAVIISLWAVFAALVGVSVGAFVTGFIFIFTENAVSGIFSIGAALFCAGLSIFAFFGCKYSTLAAFWLTKKTILIIKKCFIGKDGQNE